jgi:hypothetical protein
MAALGSLMPIEIPLFLEGWQAKPDGVVLLLETIWMIPMRLPRSFWSHSNDSKVVMTLGGCSYTKIFEISKKSPILLILVH